VSARRLAPKGAGGRRPKFQQGRPLETTAPRPAAGGTNLGKQAAPTVPDNAGIPKMYQAQSSAAAPNTGSRPLDRSWPKDSRATGQGRVGHEHLCLTPQATNQSRKQNRPLAPWLPGRIGTGPRLVGGSGALWGKYRKRIVGPLASAALASWLAARSFTAICQGRSRPLKGGRASGSLPGAFGERGARSRWPRNPILSRGKAY
jgi:hypothetical protein